MLKYIRGLESHLNNYKVNDVNLLKQSEEVKKATEAAEAYGKELKKEQFRLQRQIRGLTGEQQIHLNKMRDKTLQK